MCFCFGQILFNLVHTFAVHCKRSFVLAFLRSILITYYFDNPASGKKLLFWKKSREQVLNFGSKGSRNLVTSFKYKRPHLVSASLLRGSFLY